MAFGDDALRARQLKGRLAFRRHRPCHTERQQKIMGVFGKGLRLFRECPSQETEDCKWQLK